MMHCERKNMTKQILSLLLVAAAIGCDAPGEGPKALAGFRSSVALVQAIGEYRAQLGGYPENLEALVPKFLANSQLALPPGIHRIEYKRNSSGFELEFEYHGPGVNRCCFGSAKREWACNGYY
jgi:hypothetical protein